MTTDHLISEKGLLGFCEDLFAAYNWRMYHQVDVGPCRKCGTMRPSPRIGKGFPDVVAVHPDGRLVIAELKSQRGPIQPEQPPWLRDFANADAPEVYLWRPSDMDGIAQILQPGYTAPLSGTLVLPARWASPTTGKGKQTP